MKNLFETELQQLCRSNAYFMSRQLLTMADWMSGTDDFQVHQMLLLLYYINYCVEINADYSAQVYYIVCIYLDYYRSDQGLGS